MKNTIIAISLPFAIVLTIALSLGACAALKPKTAPTPDPGWPLFEAAKKELMTDTHGARTVARFDRENKALIVFCEMESWWMLAASVVWTVETTPGNPEWVGITGRYFIGKEGEGGYMGTFRPNSNYVYEGDMVWALEQELPYIPMDKPKIEAQATPLLEMLLAEPTELYEAYRQMAEYMGLMEEDLDGIT